MAALARSSSSLTKVRTLGALPTVATPERWSPSNPLVAHEAVRLTVRDHGDGRAARAADQATNRRLRLDARLWRLSTADSCAAFATPCWCGEATTPWLPDPVSGERLGEHLLWTPMMCVRPRGPSVPGGGARRSEITLTAGHLGRIGAGSPATGLVTQ